MFVLHFLLLLVPLVLFHELGHYLVARAMGVRVLSFSIGFGPVVFAWERGGTEYAVRALPLGGFVRMLGDDPTGDDEDGPPASDSFAAKPVWRRTLIVAAGPIANFILPIVILFVGSLAVDSEVVSARLGTVLPGGPAAVAGLRAGDRIVRVDGEEVASFMDLRRLVAARPDRDVPVQFERDGVTQTVSLRPESKRDVRMPELGVVDTVGRIQVLPDGQSAIVQVEPGGAAFAAGIRDGDRVVAVDAVATARSYELEAALAAKPGVERTLTLRPPRYSAPLSEAAIAEHDGELHDAKASRSVRLVGGKLADLGMAPAQTIIGFVEAGSPADRAGLRAGDRVLRLDGADVTSFVGLLDALRKRYDEARAAPEALGLDGDELIAHLASSLRRPYRVAVRRTLTPARRQALTGAGAKPADAIEAALLADPARLQLALSQGYADVERDLQLQAQLDRNERPRLRIGAGPLQRYEEPERVANAHRLRYAVQQTSDEMGEAVRITALTVAGLFRGNVPMREVGGPIFMAQLASRTADLGWGYFFKLMVWLSVNLAILNLLPIPIADGGHLMFLAIEAVRREPVSVRTRMIAAYVGMTFLGLLFVVVMKNDVQRLISAWAN